MKLVVKVLALTLDEELDVKVAVGLVVETLDKGVVVTQPAPIVSVVSKTFVPSILFVEVR